MTARATAPATNLWVLNLIMLTLPRPQQGGIRSSVAYRGRLREGAGISREARGELLFMVRTLRSLDGGFNARVDLFRREAQTDEGREFIEFLQQPSKRGSCPFTPRAAVL